MDSKRFEQIEKLYNAVLACTSEERTALLDQADPEVRREVGGTTLAAAELNERVCFGIELDPKYVDVVIQRWQLLTGKQATLDGRTFEEIGQELRVAV